MILPLTFLKNTSYKGPNSYDVLRERGWRSLEICHIFTYCMVLNSRFIVYFCGWGYMGGWGVVCGSHNCIILTIKTCFDKKATFLALVPVLVKQPSLHLNICMFKMKSNLKNICNLQEWYQNMHNCKSLFKQILPVGKN